MMIYINGKEVECDIECISLYRYEYDPISDRKKAKQCDVRRVITLNSNNINYYALPQECTVNNVRQNGTIRCYKTPVHKDGTFRLIEF